MPAGGGTGAVSVPGDDLSKSRCSSDSIWLELLLEFDKRRTAPYYFIQ